MNGGIIIRSLIRMTREVYHCYMDSDGKLYDKPIGSIGKRSLGKDRDDFLKNYIMLIMSTKIVSKTTKIYIRSTLPSVASVITNYNQLVNENEHINIKTAQSQLDYDGRKLQRFFPDTLISQVLGYSTCDLVQYNKMLNLAKMEYSKKNKLLDNIALKLPIVQLQDSLTDEEFHDFIQIICPFIIKHMKYVEDNLSEKAVGYMLYLTSTPQLSGICKEHYQLLKNILE